MLGAIRIKLDYGSAVALVSVFVVLAWIAYALCFANGSLGPSRSLVRRSRRRNANMLGAKDAQIR
jgi:hypothetical protein